MLVGPNGSGKTNLLEAISVLSLTRSCRGRDDADMVLWGASHYRIRGKIQSDAGEERQIEVVCETAPRKRKAYFINDVRSSLTDIVGTLPTVTFLPEDLDLFTGSPSERRRSLDQLLSQVSPGYLMLLSQYQKILQQRNALLKRIAAGIEQTTALMLWDEQLSEYGSAITLARLELIEMLNLSFGEEMADLGERWDGVALRYERKTAAREQGSIKLQMVDLLREHRLRDVALQATTVGPHREDWQVYRDGKALPTFASRGQERIAVLALLLLQVSYLELKRGEQPVILLDDAFSELDDAHRSALLSSLGSSQVIMTSTHRPPSFPGRGSSSTQSGHSWPQDIAFFDVKDGTIRQESLAVS